MNPTAADKMTRTELLGSFSLAVVMFLRMLGIFLVLPVFSIYSSKVPGANPMLVGLAFGIYGLSQALMQIPFGIMSDKLGRKPVILAGLSIFATGSLVVSFSSSIWMLFTGRVIQGIGAVSGALMGLIADLTRVQQRIKASAMIGISVSAAFSLAFAIAPLLGASIGMSGILMITSCLALLAMAILYLVTPDPEYRSPDNGDKISLSILSAIIKDRGLMQLNLGIFILHAVMASNFIIIPIALSDYAGLAPQHHWKVYLPVIIVSFILIAPAVTIKQRVRLTMVCFKTAIVMLLAAQISYFFYHSTLMHLTVTLLIFFIGFNYLEAALPSLVSIIAPEHNKGAALGAYATCQFIGLFIGGITGGIMHQHLGLQTVFIFGGIISLAWLTIALLSNEKILAKRLLNASNK